MELSLQHHHGTWIWNDLTKSPTHVALLVVFLLLGMAQFINKRHESPKPSRMLLNGLILSLVGGLEIFVYRSFTDYKWWMFTSFGNFIFWFVLAHIELLMIFEQTHLFRRTLVDLSYQGKFRNRYRFGLSATFLAVVVYACLRMLPRVCGWLGVPYHRPAPLWGTIATGLFVLLQLYVLAATVRSVRLQQGDFRYAIVSMVVYLVGLAGYCCLLLHFPLLVFVGVWLIVQTTAPVCGNCRSFGPAYSFYHTSDYCHYHCKYVDKKTNACQRFQQS